jgi:predicted ATPase
MIRKVRIANFKSIPELDLDLGRLTVLIGANGSGKSNILEAIALASAAAQGKLDNEFLISRGIRVTEMRFMYSAFSTPAPGKTIRISVDGDNVGFDCTLFADAATSYPKWDQLPLVRGFESPDRLREAQQASEGQSGEGYERIVDEFRELIKRFQGTPVGALEGRTKELKQNIQEIRQLIERWRGQSFGALPGFLVFSPENSALRTFQAEGQILPLGIRGEGLFAHLKALDSPTHRERLDKIREHLALIDWFETFVIPDNLSPGERSIGIRDRYLAGEALFDQRSASEGFLFLLFYITLFVSPETPGFFSIDNIDSSLNPKLCTALVEHVAKLAQEYDKQVILTTHNPAVLDALDLRDAEQRLLVVDRDKSGHTRVRRVEAPKVSPGHAPVSLSEAFLRGYIGGLPKNF